MKGKVAQEEIDAFVVEASIKRALGQELTDYEWMLIHYALPPACHVCGGNHHKRTRNVLGGEK